MRVVNSCCFLLRPVLTAVVLFMSIGFADHPALAHGKEKHRSPSQDTTSSSTGAEAQQTVSPAAVAGTTTGETAIDQIREAYVKEILPVFEIKCFNCHSIHTTYPWYYQLPVIRHLIDRDIAEALEHLDMSDGFPFAGHGSPAEDLEQLLVTVADGEMPPLIYGLAHPDHRLTEAEEQRITAWASHSLDLLRTVSH